ncbi:hypothetical protein ABZ517_14855 [Streptomyces scabiei]|uniref:hypothetical protein n=1 Tax=Streptomyces scabiei TaxID=1930 RepID=UPI0033FBB247
MSQTPAQELGAAAEKLRRAPETPLPPRAVKALVDLLSNGVRFAEFLTQHGDAVGVEGRLDVAVARAILDEPEQCTGEERPAPVDWQAVVQRRERELKTVGEARHRAEAAVQRVTALRERWVQAGPPPLGTPLARWWDRRLVELNAALDEPKACDCAPPKGEICVHDLGSPPRP